ncbi:MULTISPECIES: T3SS effector HopA1 family protein [unclassified Streptomyces]|uniref:T3SS effector HopA1 family protein n=1 Tax=unclassified Streptomyces TaxID=2593676 RepID=UPI000F741565|nr:MULTISPECIES: T3SS effector HopA1 family protein [unclassified Streptomyces]
MDARDHRNLDKIRRGISGLLSSHGTRGNLTVSRREDLIEKVYSAVHARQPNLQSAFSSNRAELSEFSGMALQSLSGLTVEIRGFSFLNRTAELVTVRCPDGIEVAVPAADTDVSDSGDATLRVSPLNTPMDSRWLHWNPPGRFTEKPDARVYVNVRADEAMTVWCALVRALEGAAVPFSTKIGGSTEMLGRADGVVVYSAARDVHRILNCLDGLGAADCLRGPVPGFSAMATDGIGVALDPEPSGGALSGSVGYYWSRAVVEKWTASGDEGLEAVFARLTASWADARRAIDAARAADEARV